MDNCSRSAHPPCKSAANTTRIDTWGHPRNRYHFKPPDLQLHLNVSSQNADRTAPGRTPTRPSSDVIVSAPLKRGQTLRRDMALPRRTSHPNPNCHKLTKTQPLLKGRKKPYAICNLRLSSLQKQTAKPDQQHCRRFRNCNHSVYGYLAPCCLGRPGRIRRNKRQNCAGWT